MAITGLLVACVDGGAELAAGADSEAPSTPASLSATAVSQSQINLSWSASSDNVGVAGYQIFRGVGAGPMTLLVTLGNVTNYGNTGLTAATAYTYRVRALDAAGNASGQSTPATATTLAPDNIAPSIPTNLSATAVSTSQINLSWTASTDNVAVTGYQVFRGVGAGPLTPLITLGNVTSYQDTGLTPATSYTYTVRARDAAGNFSGQSTPPVTETTQAPVACTVIGQSPAVLTWDAVTGATGYRIYFGTSPGTYQQPFGSGVDVPGGATTTTSVGGLTPQT
jgi:chitodextrinase